jgi:uncharacterized protein (DUF305 family)
MNKKTIIAATLLTVTAFALGLGVSSMQQKPTIANEQHEQHAQHEGHTNMPAVSEGSMSQSTKDFETVNNKMHRDMAITFSGNADKDFLAGMIPHHQGAIDMAEVVLKHGSDPKARKLAQDIITAQKKEIADMQEWLKAMK